MIECACVDDGDPCSFWNVSFRKARRSHVCCECREEIKPGERYQHTFLVAEGDREHYATCQTCCRIWSSVGCGQQVCGMLDELLRDTNGIGLTEVPT